MLMRISSRRWLRCRSAVASPRLFHSLGLEDDLVQRLAKLGITEPTPAQRSAIPLILNHHDVVVGAETGGGKTLAYLLPLVQKFERHPLRNDLSSIHRPVGLIMTPSQALVRQIGDVLRQLHPELAKFTVCVTSDNQSLQQHRAAPIVIATPRALLNATNPKDFAFTETIVVDEADMLLSGEFERMAKQIIATIRNQPLLEAKLNRAQLNKRGSQSEQPEDESEIDVYVDSNEVAKATQTIFCSATIPDYGLKSVRRFIDYKFPKAQFVETDGFHRTLPQLETQDFDLQEFMQAQQSDDIDVARKQLLLSILKNGTAQEKTLIFTNGVESAMDLYEFLQEQDVECSQLHKKIRRDERQQILDALDDDNHNTVVVCTDIAARGLDTMKVRHVIQYEFALNVVSFLHRSGRTARAGTTGRLSNITSAEDALWISKMREAGQGGPLNSAFSHKRSMRKKYKKALKAAEEGNTQ